MNYSNKTGFWARLQQRVANLTVASQFGIAQAQDRLLTTIKRNPVSRRIIWYLGYAPDFNGRLSRIDTLVQILIVVVIGLLLGNANIVIPDLSPGDQPNPAEGGATLLNILLLAIVLISAIIRRLHDTGRDARALVTIIIPYVGFLILIGLLLSEGEAEANKFGPPA
jgi:uncharacterized membrane protein YhaH (DUF805 family)